MKKHGLARVVLLCLALTLVPASSQAGSQQAHGDITITRNSLFDRAHGIRSGRGTAKDPYVISGWNVTNINLQDTSKAVRVVNNTIAGTLTLNWNGSNVLVERNTIGDLRVNENIPRYGMPTAGIIRFNHFDLVGQLRHFDGQFVHNTVGSPSGSNGTTFGGPIIFTGGPAVTFDGFNGARFSYNTIYGYVDARLHGHHHSSGYGMPSHMHAMNDSADHSQRYHEVFIERNHIITNSQYALAYLDTNHADNDRTAASETNPELNAPHVHYTRVHILNNTLDGAGIFVDVFNAADELHKKIATGLMDITGNRITLQHGTFYPFESNYGIQVSQAQGLVLKINHNVVTAPNPSPDVAALRSWETSGAGIFLGTLDRASVMIGADRVTNLEYGVSATDMTRTVHWTVSRLWTSGVGDAVSYDTTVANRPARN